jgi:signal peptidase I
VQVRTRGLQMAPLVNTHSVPPAFAICSSAAMASRAGAVIATCTRSPLPLARRPRARLAPRAGVEPPSDDAQDGLRFGGVFRRTGGDEGGDGSTNDENSLRTSAPGAARDKPLWRRILEDDKYDDLRTFTLAFAIALSFRALVIEPRYIPSQSMVPTFEIGDQLLVEKVSKYVRPYTPGDVVVFLPPNALVERGYAKNDAFIKRVVAAEGDSIAVSQGHVMLNGVAQSEPFIAAEPNYEWGPEKVPPGYVVVLGDNRNNSYDSHLWGFLPTSNIIGRAIVRYWPPARIGSTVLERSVGTVAKSSKSQSLSPAPATGGLGMGGLNAKSAK